MNLQRNKLFSLEERKITAVVMHGTAHLEAQVEIDFEIRNRKALKRSLCPPPPYQFPLSLPPLPSLTFGRNRFYYVTQVGPEFSVLPQLTVGKDKAQLTELWQFQTQCLQEHPPTQVWYDYNMSGPDI